MKPIPNSSLLIPHLFLTPTAHAKALAPFLAYSGHYLGSRTVAYPSKHGLTELSFYGWHISHPL